MPGYASRPSACPGLYREEGVQWRGLREREREERVPALVVIVILGFIRTVLLPRGLLAWRRWLVIGDTLLQFLKRRPG
jgi:hypothetical protein